MNQAISSAPDEPNSASTMARLVPAARHRRVMTRPTKPPMLAQRAAFFSAEVPFRILKRRPVGNSTFAA